MNRCIELIYLDYVIIGLISGIFPTIVMSIFEFPFYKIWGIKGVYELHESEMMVCKLMKRKFQNNISHMGILTHLLNGSLLSVPFVIFINLTNTNPSIIIGILYSVVIWLVTLLPVHKLITGESISENPYGYQPALVSIIGHFIYGIMLYYSYMTLGGLLN